MRSRPDGIADGDVLAALSEGWGLGGLALEYTAVGGGGYHWIASDAAGTRHFVTVDDLDNKGFLGQTREDACANLRTAFQSARVLRDRGGLEFVVAPQATRGGETTGRIGPRYAVSVYPFLDGEPGRWGEARTPAERTELIQLLVRLHDATPAVLSVARSPTVRIARRGDLDAALDDLDREWSGGPFSEPARAVLIRGVDKLRRLLDTFDQLVDGVAVPGKRAVVTHGEPHHANLIRTGSRLYLIDWDTVGLATPERDLWMIDDGTGAALREYADASGRPVDESAIAFYRVRWALDDIAEFVARVRAPHGQTADAEHAWRAIVFYLGSEES